MPREPGAGVTIASGSGKATVVGVEMANDQDDVERRAQAEAKVEVLRSVFFLFCPLSELGLCR
jgi:hypothetical protein